jgi:hypothetical protein
MLLIMKNTMSGVLRDNVPGYGIPPIHGHDCIIIGGGLAGLRAGTTLIYLLMVTYLILVLDCS